MNIDGNLIKDLIKILIQVILFGIIIFFAQQWIESRFRIIESKLSQERLYQQKSYELLVSSYKNIWQNLIILERFSNSELPKRIQKSKIEPSEWSLVPDTYFSLRGEMLFLPDSLYEKTNSLMKDWENNVNRLLELLRHPETRNLDSINAQLKTTQRAYSKGLEELTASYRSTARKVILESKMND